MKDKVKEFFASSWAIDNKTSIYIMTIIITLAGLMTYNSLPKEQFPEVVFPQILVNTIMPVPHQMTWRTWLPNTLKNKLSRLMV